MRFFAPVTATLGLMLHAYAAFAQTPPTAPAEVIALVMGVLSAVDKPPMAVMHSFLPQAVPGAATVSSTDGIPPDLNDPQALIFSVSWQGTDVYGDDATSLTCIRFGPETLAYAKTPDAFPVGPMLLKANIEGWAGYSLESLPELGQPEQLFPEGAVLRQDCSIIYGLPADHPIADLAAWPAAAMTALSADFDVAATTALDILTPNPRFSFRASGPRGGAVVQVALMLGVLPYRPFDDVTMPAFGLDVRATSYLFAPAT